MANEKGLASISLFSELSAKECKAVGRLMTSVTVKPGRDLITEGDVGREFLVITEGEATVRRGGKVVARLGPGDFMGELSVIAGVPRTASVTADMEMVVSVLNRREFSALLDAQPKVARKILVGAVKRLHDLEPAIVQ